MGPDQGSAAPAGPAAVAIAPPALPRRRSIRLGVRAPLVELARERLRRTTSVRLATVFAWGVTLTFAAIAVALRVADGADATFSGLLVQAARIIAWGGAGSVALAAAFDRKTADRLEGIETLAAVRGMPAHALDASRALAAMVQIALTLGVPLMALAAVTVVLSGSVFVAARQVGVALAVLLFAVVTGAVLGGVATAAGRFGGRRGRWLLLGVVIGPWIALDLAGRGAWSIPGALDALLELSVAVMSGARA
jgi:hypothetical protein